MKKCNKCHETKELDKFYPSMLKRSIYHCKKCHNKVSLDNAKKGKYWLKHNKNESAIKSRAKYAFKIAGVYAIYENGECLYVGESKRVLHRWADHVSYKNNLNSKESKRNSLYSKLSQHQHIIFGVLEETPNHKEREQYWITKLKPKYNEKIK